MNDKESLKMEADIYQKRMDAIADMTVFLTNEGLAIANRAAELSQRYEELQKLRDEVLEKLEAQPE